MAVIPASDVPALDASYKPIRTLAAGPGGTTELVRGPAGDVLVLYTDGTTEARARDGRFFGEDGLRDTLMREGAQGFDGLLDRLLSTVDDFTGNSLEDDVAMVALRFDKVGEDA